MNTNTAHSNTMRNAIDALMCDFPEYRHTAQLLADLEQRTEAEVNFLDLTGPIALQLRNARAGLKAAQAAFAALQALEDSGQLSGH